MDDKIEFIDPDGVAAELDYEWNLTGRFAPPVDLFEDVTPFVPGSMVREVKTRPRELTIGFWVHADSDSPPFAEAIATTSSNTGIQSTVITSGISGGQTYTFAAELSRSPAGYVAFTVNWYNNSSTYLTSTYVEVDPVTSQWTTTSTSHQAPSGATRAELFISASLSPGNYIRVRNVSFRRGSNPNLAPNPDFATGLTSWSAVGTTSLNYREADLSDAESALRVALRNLVYRMDPGRGHGYLRVTGPDGTARQIRCRVSEGLGLKERIGDETAPTAQHVVATFRSVDPYWEDIADLTPITFDTGLPPTFFPFFPLRLASSEIVAEATVTNTGDVPAYPKWTITGPGNSIKLVNKTTGEFLDFGSVTLSNGETITVDTNPETRSVLKNGSTNLFGNLAVLSTLWTLARGDNEIELQMNGSSTTSSLQLTYRRRYLSP